jgi:hypothetical protein
VTLRTASIETDAPSSLLMDIGSLPEKSFGNVSLGASRRTGGGN